MESYFKDIEKRFKKKISFEKLEIIDNSLKHKGHKFFTKDKYHLKLKIKSTNLKLINKISAHKLIIDVLKEDLKKKIHALEINIY